MNGQTTTDIPGPRDRGVGLREMASRLPYITAESGPQCGRPKGDGMSEWKIDFTKPNVEARDNLFVQLS